MGEADLGAVDEAVAGAFEEGEEGLVGRAAMLALQLSVGSKRRASCEW